MSDLPSSDVTNFPLTVCVAFFVAVILTESYVPSAYSMTSVTS